MENTSYVSSSSYCLEQLNATEVGCILVSAYDVVMFIDISSSDSLIKGFIIQY